MVHAGVLPQWSAQRTLELAAEVQEVLAGPRWIDFLRVMYGNEPARWSDSLAGADRLRVIVNALTRLRFCTPDGTMEFKAKQGADAPPHGHLPWFDVARPCERRHHGGVRALVGARAADATEPHRAGHRLRVGRRADRGGPERPGRHRGALRAGLRLRTAESRRTRRSRRCVRRCARSAARPPQLAPASPAGSRPTAASVRSPTPHARVARASWRDAPSPVAISSSASTSQRIAGAPMMRHSEAMKVVSPMYSIWTAESPASSR